VRYHLGVVLDPGLCGVLWDFVRACSYPQWQLPLYTGASGAVVDSIVPLLVWIREIVVVNNNYIYGAGVTCWLQGICGYKYRSSI
jgi:hypothetical protein